MASHDIISEGLAYLEEIPGYLAEYAVTSLESIHEEDFEEALQILKKSEKLLEAQTRHSGEVDANQVLMTLHNTACCYHRFHSRRLERLEDAAAYLNGCTYNLKTQKLPGSCPSEAIVNRLRYRSRSHMQLCGLLSQLNKHEAALHHATKALKFAEKCVQETLAITQSFLRSHKKTQISELAARAASVLESLVARLHPSRERVLPKAQRLDVRTVLGVQNYAEWIYTYDISDVMRIDPTTIEQLQHNYGLEIELTQTLLLEKVCLLAAACFCVASETRFVGSIANTSRKSLNTARAWHFKSVQISDDFLPLECPLAAHIKQTFLQCYGDSTSARVKVKKKSEERSLSRGQTNPNVSQHLKSPASTSTGKMVRQILAQSRSTSAKSRKRASPAFKRPSEVSPKPTHTRPSAVQSDKRLPKCALGVSASFKSSKTARKDDDRPKGLAKMKTGRSAPAFKGQKTPPAVVGKGEGEGKPSTREISPAPISPLEETDERESSDPEDSQSPDMRMYYTSNQLYGIPSPDSSHEEDFDPHSPSFTAADLRKAPNSALDADKLRQISSTGGRN